MNDYAMTFAKLLNKVYEIQGIPPLSYEQRTILAALLRELELPGPRKTAEQIMAAAEKAIAGHLVY
jgi:hypothetical protein